MIGKISFDLEDDCDADASPFGRCESGTRIGLCLRMIFFFCDLPMIVDLDVLYVEQSQSIQCTRLISSIAFRKKNARDLKHISAVPDNFVRQRSDAGPTLQRSTFESKSGP